MTDQYAKAERAATFLRGRLGEPTARRQQPAANLAIVLGSGLGDFTESLQDAVSIPYTDIPDWPASAVVGHAGKLVVGTIAGKRVAALSGRAHFYEGHTMLVATFATRVIGLLGIRTLILTNAAGGINLNFKPGTLMVIDDHINLMGTNPLVGSNDDRFGPRFPDMTEAYSKRLR
jgi:purine-nucleoside phosphorylase